MGEDACLLDDEESHDDVQSDMVEPNVDADGSGDVVDLLNKLSEDRNKEVSEQRVQLSSPKGHVTGLENSIVGVEEDAASAVAASPSATLLLKPLLHVPAPTLKALPTQVEINSDKSKVNEQAEDCGDISKSEKILRGVKRVPEQTTSCPPGRVHSPTSGPWSLEWAKRQKHVVDGVVVPKKTDIINKSSLAGLPRDSKKKSGGYIF